MTYPPLTIDCYVRMALDGTFTLTQPLRLKYVEGPSGCADLSSIPYANAHPAHHSATVYRSSAPIGPASLACLTSAGMRWSLLGSMPMAVSQFTDLIKFVFGQEHWMPVRKLVATYGAYWIKDFIATISGTDTTYPRLFSGVPDFGVYLKRAQGDIMREPAVLYPR